MRTITLVGGPLDSVTARTGLDEEFIWIENVDSGPRCQRVKREGWLLHKRLAFDRYLYAGDSFGKCGGCNVWHRIPHGGEPTCSMCGGVLAAA